MKNRRSSTTKQFPSPITESSSQNTSKSISNSYYAPRRRRIKSSGYLDDKTSPPTREDLLYNQDENKLKNNKNKEGADNVNSLKILEQPSPKSALNILDTRAEIRKIFCYGCFWKIVGLYRTSCRVWKPYILLLKIEEKKIQKKIQKTFSNILLKKKFSKIVFVYFQILPNLDFLTRELITDTC